MNKTNLDMNIFTMDFGKMVVSTAEHFDKVYEEYNELDEAFDIYDYKEAEGYTTNEDIEAWKIKLEDRKKKYLK